MTPAYDETSRLKELKVDNQIQMSEIVYNPMSQVTQLKTGASTNNADIEQYSYDAQTGLLTNQKVIKQNNSQTLLDLSYNYNRGNSNGSLNGKTGQLTQITDNLNANKNRSYEFDTLGRLRLAKGGATGVAANWTQSYAFDRYGNRTNVQASGVTQNNQPVPTDGLPNMSYDQTSNRITNSNYEFDQAGNQTRGQAPNGQFQRFDFDAAGRLVKIKDDSGSIIESYTYGASRQRLKTVNGFFATYYAWGGSSVLCEYSETTGNSASFKFSKSYIYAGSRLLSTQTWNGTTETTEFHHPDRLGTKLVTNNQANTSYEQLTLPFGTALNAESTGFSNQVFTSYDRSQVASLDYAVNRSYAIGQGRFTSVDPIGMSSGSISNPQSNNLFAYTQNNPIDFTDPSGLLEGHPRAGCEFNNEKGKWECPPLEIPSGGGGTWYDKELPTYSDPTSGGSGGSNLASSNVPANNNSQNNCVTLAALITTIRDELAKRGGDLLADLLGLPPTGPMSIAGHVQQFENKQSYLRKLLKDFITKGCNGPGPRPPIPSDSWQWATKAPPKKSPYRNSSPYATNDPNKQLVQIAEGVVVTAAVGYVIYRIARMIPSLAPPLWWTIPANAAIP